MKYKAEDFKEFVITGIDHFCKRFKLISKAYLWSMGINLYKGHVWGVLPTGKRVCLKTVPS